MTTSHPLPRRALLLGLSLLVALAAGLILPASPAYARDYEVSDVDIVATVSPDGTLSVVESRTFEFDGSFNGVYWELPTGLNSSNGRDVEVSVRSAGELVSGELDAFEESAAGLDGTYEVTSDGSGVTRVKIYSAHEDESVTFAIAYDATGIVTRWQDTGELYWKFVSDGWDVASNNVTCRLVLPVPEGESVGAGDNVRAWGHGPLDATVRFDGADVVFEVPGVGTDEFAEMRVTFPAAWVSGLEETPGEQLPTILSQEQQWADEANARRSQARVLYFGAIGVGVLLVLGTVVASVWCVARYRRDFRPRFQDTYFRDVPTSDHPAILGALYNGGKAEGKELTATLMRLTDTGYVRLDRVTRRRKTLLGEKEEEDYRLTRLRDVPPASEVKGRVEKAARSVDEKTLWLLFNKVAGKKKGEEAPSELLFSQIDECAKEHPERYAEAYESWQNLIEGRCLTRFSDKEDRVRGRGLLAGLAVACVAGAFGLMAALLVMEAPIEVTLPVLVLLLACAAGAFFARSSMRELSREAVEVQAKLEALERWLRDFTRLEEAVPGDVALWNRLLVMAVVLGVSEQVIKQLSVACPEVLDDPGVMATYGWLYWGGRGVRAPIDSLGEHLESAHHVSVAATAGSDFSSGSGGGGGFSGGGGGGFGGGGGGGAF